MFFLNLCAYGGESQELGKLVFEKHINLLGYQTVSKNSIRLQSYGSFFEAFLYKISTKPRLAKVSKQSSLGTIYEAIEMNYEIQRQAFVCNMTH